MVSLECGQAAKGTGVRNVFPSSCGLSPGTFLLLRSNRKASYPGDRFLSFRQKRTGGGGGGTSLQEANGDVPMDGIAFSRLDWL